MLDIQRALTFVSEDPRATQKIGLGALITLAPVLNLAAFGYQVEAARRVTQTDPQPLPEWNDLGRLWKQGAWLGLAYYLYSLPIILLVFGGMAAGFISLILSLQSSEVQSGTQSAGPPVLFLAIIFSVVGVAFLYGFVFGLLRPAILAEYIQRGTLGACFDFRALWRFAQHNFGEYLQLWLVELGLGVIITVPLILLIFIVAFIPLVGPLLVSFVAAGASFYTLLVSSHLVGQLLRARSQSHA